MKDQDDLKNDQTNHPLNHHDGGIGEDEVMLLGDDYGGENSQDGIPLMLFNNNNSKSKEN